MTCSWKSRISLIGILSIQFAGCCKPNVRETTIASDSHGIFNPTSSPVALTDFDRTDWPVAYLGESTSEEIQFHEQIIDIHGRGFGRDDGFLLRRFESDRFGRSRR